MKYICYCDQVTEQDVLDAIGNGARTVSDCIQNILLGHLVAVTNILHFSSNPSTRKKGR